VVRDERAGPGVDERLAVGFARLLRQLGIAVTVGSTVTFARALGEVGVADESAVYWAGRATLLNRPEDAPLYDRAFAAWWRGHAPGAGLPEPEEQLVTIAVDDPDGDDPGVDDGAHADEDRPTITLRWSATEVLRAKDFAECTAGELEEAHRLMADIRMVGALRRSRRHRPSNVRRGRPDIRRTVKGALHSGGDVARLERLAPGTRRRRIVLLLDVSGSMEPYARALMRFAHAAVAARRQVEAFALGTRLTRLTRELSSRDPDEALTRAASSVADWSGGTRLGDGLRAFNDEWGVRGMARGAIVVLLSDGWDRGDPADLAEQMARLQRVAHKVVWVNPLKASPGYQPLARGMAAALPHVDEFVEGHSLASLEELAEVLR
jgi:uncharacterized protein with von Willebrand factor type A (vWA) domain